MNFSDFLSPPFFQNPLFQNSLIVDSVSSVIFIVAAFVLQAVTARAIKRNVSLTVEARRHWMISLRNITAIVIVGGLFAIWSHELRTFAVSLVAIAAAIVLAIKELIMCISGALLRARSSAYRIGDRISIGGSRGDVIDYNLFTTTILEASANLGAHQRTGKSVIVPNSLLLSMPVINESFTGEYVLQSITIPLSIERDWQQGFSLLKSIAHETCTPHLEPATHHFSSFASSASIRAVAIEPSVSIILPVPNEVHLVLRVAMPARTRDELTQIILLRFLTEFYHKN
jgi:small-conductance mechanosensitive channel